MIEERSRERGRRRAEPPAEDFLPDGRPFISRMRDVLRGSSAPEGARHRDPGERLPPAPELAVLGRIDDIVFEPPADVTPWSAAEHDGEIPWELRDDLSS